MDVDAYVAAHEPQWRRLDALLKRRRLTGDEVDAVPASDLGPVSGALAWPGVSAGATAPRHP